LRNPAYKQTDKETNTQTDIQSKHSLQGGGNYVVIANFRHRWGGAIERTDEGGETQSGKLRSKEL